MLSTRYDTVTFILKYMKSLSNQYRLSSLKKSSDTHSIFFRIYYVVWRVTLWVGRGYPTIALRETITFST